MGKHGYLQWKLILILTIGLLNEGSFGYQETIYDEETNVLPELPLLEENSPDFVKVHRVHARVLQEVVEEAEDKRLNNERLRASRHNGGAAAGRKREKRHVPVTSTKHPTEKGHMERLRLELPLDSNHVILDLNLNKDLLTKGYFEKYQNGDGHVIQRPNFEEAELCHYHGKIINRPESWAAISTCDGVIRGVVFDGIETHYLEPPTRSSNPGNPINSLTDEKSDRKEDSQPNLNEWEVMHYKHTDFKRNLSCGHDEHKDILPGFSANESHSRSKRGAANHDDIRVPHNSNGKSRYVELVMVVDNKKYKDLGSDYKRTIRRTKDIANIVNALYQPFNIFIALVGVVVWTEKDEITISTNGDTTLSSFLHYRKERLLKEHPNDNAQLLTAVEFENGVVGKAMQGPICSFKYSGGVNSDFRNNLVGIVATTVAHELGHNFGLAHDQADECQCSAPGNRCIMAASASSNQTSQWSSCSAKDMAFAIDHGMDYCLRNIPKSLYDGPTCGNGFTEPGEECDCGLPEKCDNPCCDASTCMIHINATCASGTCCDVTTCHFQSGGTPCRETAGLCDLPEYCTGNSEFCPDNVHKLDGLTCETKTGKAYCYDGECRTHTDQCKLLWGPSGNNSNDLCYQRNTNGSKVAHCGYNFVTDKYAQCRSENVKCGVLHCEMNTEKLEFGYESAAILASFFVNAGGKIHPCRSVIVDFGLQDVNPGLVPDGASCGTEKMCVSQECVSVKSILGSLADGCGDCSGHGVCNSKGHCHCEEGYGGHLCEGSGYGGSIDSGPAYHKGTSRLAKALYVTVFGFIPLIAIITFYFYYANDYLKKLCLEIRRGGLRAQLVAASQQPGIGPGSGGGSKHMSNGSARSNGTMPGQQGGSNPSSPDGDFFGNYKGFTLSPIKASPKIQRNGNAGSGSATGAQPSAGVSNKPNNNNNLNGTLPNGHIKSRTNENVYYSPVARATIENETLVGNSSEKVSTLKKGPTAISPNFLTQNRPSTRVSWAQPIASRLPVSPPSPGEEEDSANSDTPLYENTSGTSTGNSSPLHVTYSANKPHARPLSSPIDTLKALDNDVALNNKTSKIAGFGRSNSALQRIAAAFPFVRNSLRSSNSQEDNIKQKKQNMKREGLEISKPILQSEFDSGKIQHCIPINGNLEEKQQPIIRYANITENPQDQVDSRPNNSQSSQQQQQQQQVKSALKMSFQQRLFNRDSTPPPEPVTKKPIPKVQRAHSMIQPSTCNRNSTESNPNYNSLRRARPSAPPPKPPEGPPPSPPNTNPPAVPTNTSIRSHFFKSSTPPPYTSSAAAAASSQGSPSSMRNSILKFSFGGHGRLTGPSWLASKVNSLQNNQNSSPIVKAPPLAKNDELGSPNQVELPPSPPSGRNNEDNIYDTIDEGIPLQFEHKKVELASSEESSPTKNGHEKGSLSCSSKNSSLEEKIETLSTGSSENGLLADIISEIKTRNKESIYNSVDRRKQKAMKKAAAAAAALAEKEKASNIGINGSWKKEQAAGGTDEKRSSSISSRSRSNSPALYTAPKPPSISTSSLGSNASASSIGSSKSYGRPTVNFNLISNSSNNKTSPPTIATKPKITDRPSSTSILGRATVNATSVTSRPSSYSPRASISSSSSSNPSTSLYSSPAASTTAANSSNSLIKPTCAVNGIPKIITNPRSRSISPSGSIVTKTPPPSVNGVSKLASSSTITTPPPPTSQASGFSEAPPPPIPAHSSPSYVAKINYFSNLGSSAGGNNSNTPMKPISSLPAPTSDNPAKEIIYAPSSVGVNADGGERNHLSTIRRSRPSYVTNQGSFGENETKNDQDCTAKNNSFSTNNGNTTSVFVKKPGGGGIYASLGRKVPTPVIRSNSIEKEKIEIKNRRSLEDSTTTIETIIPTLEEKSTIEKEIDQVGGYKPFNPYLNRPLTFSTFRPGNNSSSNNNPVAVANGNNATGLGQKNNVSLNNPIKPVTISSYR